MLRILIAACLLVTVLAALPAHAQPVPDVPPSQCMPVYSETEIGPVKIVRPDSCTVRVYVCDREGGAILEAEKPLDCVLA